MACRPAFVLLPWEHTCEGQACFSSPSASPANLLCLIPTVFRWTNLALQCGASPHQSGCFGPFLAPHAAAGGRLVCNREREAVLGPTGRFPEAWALLGQTPSNVESVGSGNHRWQQPLPSFPVFLSSSLLFHPLFSEVCSRHRGRSCDGSRPSTDEGWGSSRQFQFDANDLCTIQGQRMICEACAPTHTSTHNLVLDYISI